MVLVFRTGYKERPLPKDLCGHTMSQIHSAAKKQHQHDISHYILILINELNHVDKLQLFKNLATEYQFQMGKKITNLILIFRFHWNRI